MMSKSPQKSACVNSTGTWVWNNETDELEYFCASDDEEETADVDTDAMQRTPAKRRLYGLEKPKTVGPAQLNAYRDAVKQSHTELITIDHVKLVAVCLMVEKDSLAIPLWFMKLIKGSTLNRFLANFLLYLSCLAEKKTLEHPKGLNEKIHPKESMRIKAEIRQANVKVELAMKHLAICYSELFQGAFLSLKYNKATGRVSNPHRDRQLLECLSSFLCYVGWITFGSQDLKTVKADVGYLFFGDYAPAHEAQSDEPEKEEQTVSPKKYQPESKESHRKCRLKSKHLTKRSPIIVCLLPSQKEKAPHLWAPFPHKHEKPETLSNIEDLEKELTKQLESFSFGILGQPLNQFNEATLTPLEPEKKDENEDEDEYGQQQEPNI